MKVLVTYYSQTGNTTKVATAIHEAAAAQGHGSDLIALGEVTPTDLGAYDLVFLGSTCHHSDLAAPAKKLLADLAPSPPFKLAGFVTHATAMPGNEQWGPDLYEKWAGRCVGTFEGACRATGIPFLGYFHCMGAPSGPIGEFIHNTIISDDVVFAAYMDDVKGHPDAADLERARLFALQMLEACWPGASEGTGGSRLPAVGAW